MSAFIHLLLHQRLQRRCYLVLRARALMNPGFPGNKHKLTEREFWVDCWPYPRRPKTMIKLSNSSKSPSLAGYHTSDSQENVQLNRLPEEYSGRRNSLPCSVKSSNRTVQAGGEPNIPSGASDLLNSRLQQGIALDSHACVEILKLCLKPEDLSAVKQVHECAIRTGMHHNTYVANSLLNGYVRCGKLEDACRVFDELVKKDVVSWNVMIGGYGHHRRAQDAIELFHQMRREGLQPTAVTYLIILKACSSLSALKLGEELHAYIRQGGFESDVRVGTALLSMYAKCGSIVQARETFEDLTSRNVISWNAMIKSYAETGCGEEAYRLLLRMEQEGFQPTAITYLSILNAFVSARALNWVREVHNRIIKAGFQSDVRVSNALVHTYAQCASIDEARRAFDKMEERNVISWNAMVGGLAQHGCGNEAYQLFLRMKREGFKPTAVTFVNMLNAGGLQCLTEVHRHAREEGFESDVRVGNALVHTYATCGRVEDARLAFDRIQKRDVVSWNVMIGGVAKHGLGAEAFELLLRMKREGFKPTAVTYLGILNASASGEGLEWVREVHSHACEDGFDSDVRVGNALLHMYAKCGTVGDARLAFDRMKSRNVISWNVMVGAYAESGCGEEAYRLLLQMKQEGLEPDAFTYASILNACANAGALEWVRDVHRHARDAGLDLDLRVGNALVHMYGKCGSIADARLVFDRMPDRDLITWNVMIGGLAQHGCGAEALELFGNMQAAGVKPDGVSFVALLTACSHAGLVDEGRRLFQTMSQEYGVVARVIHWTCMVDILGRAGLLEQAKLLIDNMPVPPSVATWGALLGACRSYGNLQLGELAALERLKLEPNDPSTYVLLSNIYAAAEQWEKVAWVRTVMRERGVFKEPGRSWIEVGNKVHAFFVGDNSHPETEEIYAELSRLTEKVKAEGYRPDTHLVLRDVDEKDKEFGLCYHSEKLAIAYGLIHTPTGAPVHVHKNIRVCVDCHTATKLISKVTGREIVVRDVNRFHHFKDGLCSCKDYW